MVRVFKKPAKDTRRPRQTSQPKKKEDLMDPVLYIGGLDKEKYPTLPIDNEPKEETEVENPLNKR